MRRQSEGGHVKEKCMENNAHMPSQVELPKEVVGPSPGFEAVVCASSLDPSKHTVISHQRERQALEMIDGNNSNSLSQPLLPSEHRAEGAHGKENLVVLPSLKRHMNHGVKLQSIVTKNLKVDCLVAVSLVKKPDGEVNPNFDLTNRVQGLLQREWQINASFFFSPPCGVCAINFLATLVTRPDKSHQIRQVQEMAVEFVNAINAAAAAESECAKLRRLLEEERKLVHRLKEEKEDEAEMAKRKFEGMSQRSAGAQKDVEYATARADVAENEWVKLRRELRAAQELVQLLKPESEETGQIVLRQGDDKELELANAINAASVAESECDKLRTLLEEERKLIQRLIVEKEDEAQLGKRQIEEIGQELIDARKDAEYPTARADVAETERIKTKKELQEEKELSQLLKPECDEIRQSAMRQVEEKERELVSTLHASEIAERECAKLKRMLEEEKKLVRRLILEKDDEVQLAKRKIEEIDQELTHAQKDAKLARKDAELARKDADAAENEWTKVKRDLKNMEEHVKLLKLQCQEIKESASRQDEEKALQLANALNASVIAESQCANLKRMLIEEGKTVQRLIIEKDDEAEQAKREIEKMGRELAYAQKEAQYARNDADIAEIAKINVACYLAFEMLLNEWTKVKREVKEKEELIKLLKLQIQDTRQDIMRQVEKISQELEEARNEAEHAQNDADIAKNEWTKVKREVKEKEELIKLLKLEIQDTRQDTMRQVEEISQKLEEARNEAEHAQNDADIAKNEWIKAKKYLLEKLELIQILKLECQETSERAKRQVEEKELELADTLNAVTSASSSSSVAQDCAICLTNEKDLAFGCGHMTCEECGKTLSMCPICRESSDQKHTSQEMISVNNGIRKNAAYFSSAPCFIGESRELLLSEFVLLTNLEMVYARSLVMMVTWIISFDSVCGI
ncbi:hypothetical protein K1719_023063 [Acacia pycnantha]|nr:hypothetical protein K1719_023063 [Acacia pycnantha]